MHVTSRALAVSALALALSACAANPKKLTPSTEITDAAPPAPAPVAEAAPAPVEAPPAEAPACALARVQFAYDSAQLDARAMDALREGARCLGERGAKKLLVEGHADERGTVAYNVALGSRRAEAVKKYLVALGVGAAIDTVSFGEELPLAQGEDEAAWSQNRRAELRLPGDARSDGKVFAPDHAVAGR
jgi:peptidoglycan-associated lipoprotein